MRIFVFSLLLAAAVAAQSVNSAAKPAQPTEPPKKARLEGLVVGLTGEAIPRATLRLTGGTSATATADDAGKFVFADVTPADNYRLSAQRPGYVPAQYGARSVNGPGAPLTLAEGQILKGLTITMTPQAVISGKIVDRDNDAILGATVFTLRIGYERGVRTLLPGASAMSDDKGEYRIANLAPGRYYLGVATLPDFDTLIAGAADRTNAREANVGTYYPNAADFQSAAPVEVTPGADVRDMDIRMRRSRTFVIRGKAVNSTTGGPSGVILLYAAPKQDATPSLDILRRITPVTTQTAQDGTFELRNLSGGEWTITAMGSVPVNGGAPSNLFGNTSVSIRDEDVAGVVLPLDGGVSNSGSLRLDGGDIKAFLASVAPDALSRALAVNTPSSPLIGGRPLVALTEVGPGGGGFQTTQVGQDGTFKTASVNHGKFALYLTRLPATYYVKSVHLGPSDVTHSVLDFTSGAGESIDILLGDKPAEVTGSVHNDKNQLMAGIMVALWPKEPELASETNGVRTVYTDQNGSFQFKTLPPGEYYLAAWEGAEAAQLQNRDLLAMFSDDGSKIKLDEGAKPSVEAKLITSQKLAAAVAKLP